MAATAIGGTLLLLQIAHHKGYIKVEIFFSKLPKITSFSNLPFHWYRWTGVRWRRTRLQWLTRLRRSCTSSPSLVWKSFRSLLLLSCHDHPLIFCSGMECQKYLPGWWLHWGIFPWHCILLIPEHCWSERLGCLSLLKSGYAAFSHWPSQPPQRLYEYKQCENEIHAM